ncbi:hypothetical protein DFH09DRAFT_1369619 [Mycena vulgaris]|nr:hypothetical protein DFH09DRAFT_1369619 [Mycena vulgaris]
MACSRCKRCFSSLAPSPITQQTLRTFAHRARASTSKPITHSPSPPAGPPSRPPLPMHEPDAHARARDHLPHPMQPGVPTRRLGAARARPRGGCKSRPPGAHCRRVPYAWDFANPARCASPASHRAIDALRPSPLPTAPPRRNSQRRGAGRQRSPKPRRASRRITHSSASPDASVLLDCAPAVAGEVSMRASPSPSRARSTTHGQRADDERGRCSPPLLRASSPRTSS